MKKVLLSLITVSIVALAGCTKEEEHNHVTITFDEPTEGEIIALADAADVHVHIEFAYEVEGEEVEIKLHPEGDETDLIINHDAHSHDNPIVFMQNVDLSSYPAGTEFHLEAKACENHECTESVTEDIHFFLGQ